MIRSRYCRPPRWRVRPPATGRRRSTPGLPDTRYTLQVYVEDCTGCGLCVEACPVSAGGEPVHKAINLDALEPLLAGERENIAFFEQLPPNDRSRVDFGTVRGAQFLEPLFSCSGACAGCGETPYLNSSRSSSATDLTVANATGCSSIYGGNRRPRRGRSGRRGADGMVELAVRGRASSASDCDWPPTATELAPPPLRAARRGGRRPRRRDPRILAARVHGFASSANGSPSSGAAARRAGGAGRRRSAQRPRSHLVRRGVYLDRRRRRPGLRHRLRRAGSRAGGGRNVNVLVLDTEVYSNTGGQMSKATPLGAVAKFSAAGKTIPTKDLAAARAIALASVHGASRWAPTRSRPCARSARPRRTTDRH